VKRLTIAKTADVATAARKNNKKDTDFMKLEWQLYHYIKKRAEVEGVGFELDIDTFKECVERCASTFGVVHNKNEMLYDEQEPYEGFFSQIKKEIAELN
jgi:hypothetical protein